MSDPVPLVVTGAGGRVGRLLRAAWVKAPPEGLRVLWSARTGGDLRWDIGSGRLPALPGGAIVLHLAGATRGPSVDRAAPLALTVCAAARDAQARHVFLASTAAVYTPGAGAMTETAPIRPCTPYGIAKRAMERAVLDWQARTAGAPPVTLLRLGNVAGADALFAAIARGGPVSLDPAAAGAQTGPVRSWIGPRTLLRVVVALALRVAQGGAVPQVLNIAQEPPLAMADVLAASGLEWRFGPPNPDVVPRMALDTGRLRRLMDLPRATAADLVSEWQDSRPSAPEDGRVRLP